MPQLKFDRPEPDLTQPEDADTLAAIQEESGNYSRGKVFPLKNSAQSL
ncbi:MAG: hypothetical protein JO051_13810 [Acidobacteriaceae bacterium]|nr:hypothetical protein [Acidobacteriaceae bacterium]